MWPIHEYNMQPRFLLHTFCMESETNFQLAYEPCLYDCDG